MRYSLSIIPQHAFGLDISDRSIEALEVKRSLGRSSLTAYGRVELELGIVDRGQVIDRSGFETALRRLLAQPSLKALKTKHVIVSLPESRVFSHIFQLPGAVSEKMVGESVQYQAEETIPLSFDQVYHDFHVIAQGAETQEVYYAACPKDVLDGMRSALLAVGLVPVVFEPEALALARAMRPGNADFPYCIVDIGARTTTVTLYDRHGIRYSRSVPVAGGTLTDQIAKELGVPAAEAERVKQTVGFTGTGKKKFSGDEFVGTVAGAIKEALEYYRRTASVRIERTIICGGTSLVPGLVERIQQRLSQPVTIGDPFVHIELAGQVIPARSPKVLYATVVGLALRGAHEASVGTGVNLLRREHEYHLFSLSRFFPKKTEAQPAPAKNRRMITLLAIFGVLIVVFVVLLLVRPSP